MSLVRLLFVVPFFFPVVGCIAETTGTAESERESMKNAEMANEKHDDADGDGFTVKEGDCNDSDARAFPGQKKSFSEPHKLASGELSFDFDCDGTITREETIGMCLGAASPEGEVCSCTPGWIGEVPECGKTGDYSPATTCGPTPSEKRVQSCR